MGLARSLVLWLAGSSTVVLVAHGVVQLRQEREDLEAAARAELALLTVAIQAHVESATRDSQEPDIANLLAQLDLKNDTLDVFVYDGDGHVLASSPAVEATRDHVEVLARAPVDPDRVNIQKSPNSAALVSTAPIRAHGGSARLVIVRPMDSLFDDVAREQDAIAVSLAVLVMTLFVVTSLVVHYRVHKPMSRLTSGIRRIASGEFSTRLGFPGSDEIALISREADGIATSLQQAAALAAAEAEARERRERDMQRANKLATVGELGAMLAHEIGSPLQVLHGRARALAARSDLPADAKRSASILVTQTERIDRIVQRLLDFARRKPLKTVDLDIREAVTPVLELLEREASRVGVRVEFKPEKVPRIRADADQVQQVLFNLLRNALRACEGGGSVTIEVAQSSMKRSNGREQPSVAVIVEDDGVGIPEAKRSKVFEPFFSGWLPDKDVPGTGLGLTVVQSIVRQHGGSVEAHASARGRGARFIAHFPTDDVNTARFEAGKP
jgi:signal transduction histidine kinase